MEPTLCFYLKGALEDVNHSPLLGLSLFQRFSSLMHRTFIQGRLESVLQNVVGYFQKLFKDMLNEMDNDFNECIMGKRSTIETILLSRQRSLKARHWMEASVPIALSFYRVQ